MFALGAQNRLDEQAYQLMAFVAILLGMMSFAAFFYLIDYASRLLRPISILTRVGTRTLERRELRLGDAGPVLLEEPGAGGQRSAPILHCRR